MKKLTPLIKLATVSILMSMCLTGCQDFDGMFGGDSGRSSDGTSYSGHSGYHAKAANQNTSTDATKATPKKVSASASQSGTAAATASTPAASPQKGTGVPLNAPAVPSTAPTVGQ